MMKYEKPSIEIILWEDSKVICNIVGVSTDPVGGGTDDSDASDEGGIATEEGGIGFDVLKLN